MAEEYEPERLEREEDIRYVPQSLELLSKEKLEEMISEGTVSKNKDGKVLTIIAAVAGG